MEILADRSALTMLAAACKVQCRSKAEGPCTAQPAWLCLWGYDFLLTQGGPSYSKGTQRAAVYQALCEMPPLAATLVENCILGLLIIGI